MVLSLPPLKFLHLQVATTDLLKGEKRDRNHKILKDVMSEETTSAENVMERENFEEKAKMHHRDEDKIVGEKIKSLQQEGIFSTMKEPKISGDISVTDGSETQDLKTKEKVITGHETKKNRVAAVQDEPSEQKKVSVQQTVDLSIQGVKDKPTFSFELSSVKNIKTLEKAKKLKQTDQEKKPEEAENVANLKTQEIGFSELVKSLQDGSPNHSLAEYEKAEEKSDATEPIQSEISAKQVSAKYKTLPQKQARHEINLQSLQLIDSQSKENELGKTEDKHKGNVSHMSENKTEGIQLPVSKGIPKKKIPQDKADPLKKKTLEQIQQLPQYKGIPDNEVIMNEGRDSGKISAADKLTQKEKREGLAKTEQIVSKGVKLEPLRSKGKTSITKKGKKADLLETSEGERVSLKDKEQKLKRSEDTQVKTQPKVREVETDTIISAEDQKTTIRNIFRKSPTRKNENSEAVPQKKTETQKQRQLQPVRGKAQDAQSKIIRINDKTVNVNTIKDKEAIERMPLLTPLIDLTYKESLLAGDFSEKCATILEAGHDTVEKERLDIISAKIKPPPTEKQNMSLKVHLETGENKITGIKKISKQEQCKRKATCTAKPVSKELPSEKFPPERLKLLKPGEKTDQSVDSKMITDKCTKITERLDRRVMQASSRSDKMILRDITEEISSMTVTGRPVKIISSEASQECIETDSREQKQPERKASAADLTEVTSKESLTEKLQMVAKPKEAESIQTESEFPLLQEPQQKLTKPQEIIVEPDQLKVSTVKDKTFKAIPNKERKMTQKQIERGVSFTPMLEEITKEPEVAPEDMSEIKAIEFAAAEDDIGVTVGTLPKESLSLKVRQQMLAKTQEAEDQPTPSKLKVTLLHGKPKTQELQIKREVSNEEISKINPIYKINKEFHELEINAHKETGPTEAICDDLSENDYHKKADAQKGKRRTSAKSKKISTEEARKVAVSDEYCNVAPSEATQIRQEQMKRMTSVVPVMDKAAEQTPATKNNDTKDILQQTITSDDVETAFTFRKEKEIKVEEIQSNLHPDKSKGDKVASIQKKTLKRQEQIDITALEASESDVTYRKYLAEYDYSEKEDKTAKPPELEEKKTRWEQTKAEVTSEVKIKETKPDEVRQEKDVAQKLSKVNKIAAEVINEADENGVIPTSVVAKPPKQEQIEQRGLVTILEDKAFNEQTTEEILSKTITVKVEYGIVHPFEVSEMKQEQVKRMFSVPPVMDDASEKTQVAQDGKLITDTCKYITAKTKDIVKDKLEKTDAKTEVSRAVEHDLTHQNTLVEKSVTETEIPTETFKKTDAIPIMKEAIKTKEGQKLDKTIIFENVPTKIKSLKEKQSRLAKNTNISLKDMQSKRGKIKNEYGSVTQFDVTETKQEQIKSKFSVVPEMKLASEQSEVVKDGDVKSETLRRHITPDELIKDTASRKEYLHEMDDTYLTMDTEVITVEQDNSNVDPAHETEVSPIREELHERWKQTEGKASVASEAEEKYQQTFVGQKASEKSSIMDTTTTLLPPDEIKHRQKQTKEKTFDVIPATGVVATEKDTQSNKSKFLNKKGQMLEKGTFSLEEVQSMVVTVKDVYGRVSPLKDGDFKSDLQRAIIPDKDVKGITSRKEGIYESSEVPLIRHVQSPLSPQGRLEISAEKHEITDKNIQAKEVTENFKTNQTASVGIKQKQKVEWTAVTYEKTPETLVAHDKTGAANRDHSPGHEEVKYDCTPQKKSYFLKDQHPVTAEGIPSNIDTIRYGTLAVETKPEQTEQIEILKQSLGERDKSDVTAEEIHSKVVTAKDRTVTFSPIKGAEMRLEHTVSKATEGTSKQLLISGDRPEMYTKRDILKDRTETKEEIRTAFSAKQETENKEQWQKSKSAKVEAARATKIRQDQVEKQPTVTSLFEEKPKKSLIEEGDLGRQLKLAKLKETEPEKLTFTKHCHANKKTEIEDTDEQIKGEMIVTPTKRNEEMCQFRQIINAESKISDKYKPAMQESKADIDLLPLYEPTVKEPSVTDKTKETITKKKTTDYKTDSTGYREGPTGKWKPEVKQSCLEDVQYVPPQEVETITRKMEGAQGIQSIIENQRVLSLEPEGKANASLQQSSRGI